jgi:hypothetical protein
MKRLSTKRWYLMGNPAQCRVGVKWATASGRLRTSGPRARGNPIRKRALCSRTRKNDADAEMLLVLTCMLMLNCSSCCDFAFISH